eukprot:TRINITY_DN21029_c0_g2_i1.p1 TRINITY_DN21029_c0_g2~~TRINITY_DN21029_c0_g2_i1.p1  ORF type:complete len:102 (+),score=12.97 TRINITY_DN21029_c0_g2_i1:226-531(+)
MYTPFTVFTVEKKWIKFKLKFNKSFYQRSISRPLTSLLSSFTIYWGSIFAQLSSHHTDRWKSILFYLNCLSNKKKTMNSWLSNSMFSNPRDDVIDDYDYDY